MTILRKTIRIKRVCCRKKVQYAYPDLIRSAPLGTAYLEWRQHTDMSKVRKVILIILTVLALMVIGAYAFLQMQLNKINLRMIRKQLI